MSLVTPVLFTFLQNLTFVLLHGQFKKNLDYESIVCDAKENREKKNCRAKSWGQQTLFSCASFANTLDRLSERGATQSQKKNLYMRTFWA